MIPSGSHLKDLHILAVDDEVDTLDTIEDILDESRIERAMDYDTASRKIREMNYDLVILDIMGVNGLDLLEKSVERGIPAVMLTAHAFNADTLKESFQKGAVSYLPKEELVNLDEFLEELLGTLDQGRHPWKLLFKRFEHFFKKHFGSEWDDESYWEQVLQQENKKYWDAIEAKARKYQRI
ncbi:response regulator [candidate division KSB3 bacterium]|uniref:Response regulator n=1 Tax=candidate division KSB3 bacterium TaxID=2044937 RepID=A0A2G6KLK8_9BACT|nr:MAG: response regulator [candidate division KSB3 bacterium]